MNIRMCSYSVVALFLLTLMGGCATVKTREDVLVKANNCVETKERVLQYRTVWELYLPKNLPFIKGWRDVPDAGLEDEQSTP